MLPQQPCIIKANLFGMGVSVCLKDWGRKTSSTERTSLITPYTGMIRSIMTMDLERTGMRNMRLFMSKTAFSIT